MTNGDLAPHTQNYPPKSATEKEEACYTHDDTDRYRQSASCCNKARNNDPAVEATLMGSSSTNAPNPSSICDQLSELY